MLNLSNFGVRRHELSILRTVPLPDAQSMAATANRHNRLVRNLLLANYSIVLTKLMNIPVGAPPESTHMLTLWLQAELLMLRGLIGVLFPDELVEQPRLLSEASLDLTGAQDEFEDN